MLPIPMTWLISMIRVLPIFNKYAPDLKTYHDIFECYTLTLDKPCAWWSKFSANALLLDMNLNKVLHLLVLAAQWEYDAISSGPNTIFVRSSLCPAKHYLCEIVFMSCSESYTLSSLIITPLWLYSHLVFCL